MYCIQAGATAAMTRLWQRSAGDHTRRFHIHGRKVTYPSPRVTFVASTPPKKRRRREPIRRPIPASAIGRRIPTPRHASGLPLRPEHGSTAMTDRLVGAPLEAVPLYAALAILHEWTAGLPANTCLGSSMMMIEALRHLGFDAELLTAYIEVRSIKHQDRPSLESLGRPDGSAIANPDGSSIDGHVIVWASAFKRFVDSSVIQLPLLRAAAEHDEIQQLPVVSPMPSREALCANRAGVPRDPCLIVYRVFADGLAGLAPALRGQTMQVFQYGGLNLAHHLGSSAVAGRLPRPTEAAPDVSSTA
jgi:hypothetical protein